MHKPYQGAEIVRAIVRKAVKGTLREWRERELDQEPPLTERLVTRIHDGINEVHGRRIHFTALSIPDRGRGALEHDLGADVAGVMNIRIPEYESRKLFLAQAKIARGRMVDRGELARLVEQCEKMIKITPDSVVMLYSEHSVDVVTAHDVLRGASAQLGRKSGGLDAGRILYRKPLDAYLGEVYMTWQGDAKLGPEIHALRDLQRIVDQTRARRGLAILSEASSERRGQESFR